MTELFFYSVANLLVAALVGIASRNRSVLALMLAYGTVMAVFGSLSISQSIGKSDGITYYLFGSDGEAYIEQARVLANAGIFNLDTISSNYIGFQIYLAFWITLFGDHLAALQFANNLLLYLTVLALHESTILLTKSKAAGAFACVAFLLTSAHTYHSLVVLKEPALCLAFSLLMLSTCQALQRKSIGAAQIFYFTIALAIITTMRGALLLFAFLFLGLISTLLMRKRPVVLIGAIGALALLAAVAQRFTTHEFDVRFFVETVAENSVLGQTLASGEVDLGGVVGRVSSAYLGLPFAVKSALFFVPVALQYFLPFDILSASFLNAHIAALFSQNLNIVWLIFVGPWCIFAALKLRNLPSAAFRRLLTAGIFYYALIAVIYGGAIPRYAAPALLFFYPAVGYWYARTAQDTVVRLQRRNFFVSYYCILAVLVTGYILLKTST